MKRVAAAVWLVSGLLILLGSLAIHPAQIVHHFLPPYLPQYETGLVNGLRLTKGFLLLDGILCLLAPFLGRWLDGPANGKEILACSDPVSRSELALIGAVTFLGAALRLYHLGVGFSWDEIVISESLMEKSIPFLLARAEVWRTLYALCGHVLYGLVGRSEFVAHLPSFFCGTASIPVLYFFVRDSLGKKEAFWSAVFLAVSGFHIWYSQMATSYSMALFFSLLSMLILPRCLMRPGIRPWISWGVVLFLALYSHFFVAAFAILGQAAYLICLLRERRISWLPPRQFLATVTYCGAVFLTLAVFNLPLYANILTGLAGSQNANFMNAEPRGTVIGQLGLFREWLFQPYAPGWLQWYGVAIAALGFFLLWRRSKAVAVYICLPTVVLWVIFATGILRRITPRHSIFTLIPLCVLLSVCATASAQWVFVMGKRFGRVAAPFLVASPLLAASVISLTAYYQRERSVFRPTSVFLNQHVSSGENIYIAGFGYDPFHYYLPPLQKIGTYDQLGELLSGAEPFWLVVYSEDSLRALPPPLQASLRARGTLRFDYVGFPEQYADPYESYVWYVRPATPSRPDGSDRE
jgi:4-amino-4-deoxy-L-arabinose transferase-like glycosyltransferase